MSDHQSDVDFMSDCAHMLSQLLVDNLVVAQATQLNTRWTMLCNNNKVHMSHKCNYDVCIWRM